MGTVKFEILNTKVVTSYIKTEEIKQPPPHQQPRSKVY